MSQIQILLSDQGRTFEVNQGDEIFIRLEENLGTGYQWNLQQVDAAIVELLGTNFSPDYAPGIGGSGMQNFHFRTNASGHTKIHLRLKRPWESANASIEHFTVGIQVK